MKFVTWFIDVESIFSAGKDKDVVLTTVGELREALKGFPDDMPLVPKDYAPGFGLTIYPTEYAVQTYFDLVYLPDHVPWPANLEPKCVRALPTRSLAIGISSSALARR